MYCSLLCYFIIVTIVSTLCVTSIVVLLNCIVTSMNNYIYIHVYVFVAHVLFLLCYFIIVTIVSTLCLIYCFLLQLLILFVLYLVIIVDTLSLISCYNC